MSKYYFIYKTINLVNGRFYIGKHETDVLNDHYFGSGKLVCRAIKRYGLESFKREILFFCKDRQELEKLEKKLVTDKFIQVNKPLIYNVMEGGQGGSNIKTEECRKKISLSLIGKSSWNKGKHHNENTKREIGKKAKERWENNVYREKIIKSFKKKSLTKEHKMNIGRARKGKQHTKEAIKKISQSKVGKVRSEEAKKRISEGCIGRIPWNKGRAHSPESRKKISETKLMRNTYKKLLQVINKFIKHKEI